VQLFYYTSELHKSCEWPIWLAPLTSFLILNPTRPDSLALIDAVFQFPDFLAPVFCHVFNTQQFGVRIVDVLSVQNLLKYVGLPNEGDSGFPDRPQIGMCDDVTT
jgi:hypothetical protein